MKNKLIIISHRRSGTHFLWETLSANIIGMSNKPAYPFKHHLTYDSKLVKNFLTDNTIFLVRDLRDVLVANWYYWKSGAEPNFNVRNLFIRATFEDYIYGRIDKRPLFSDPIGYWMEYVKWADYFLTVRFEDLKYRPGYVIRLVCSKFNLDFKFQRIKTRSANIRKPYEIKQLVGLYPRKGLVGDWKNYFTVKDHEYLWDRAGKILTRFGYTPNGFKNLTI